MLLEILEWILFRKLKINNLVIKKYNAKPKLPGKV
jgi:hypothetical protein